MERMRECGQPGCGPGRESAWSLNSCFKPPFLFPPFSDISYLSAWVRPDPRPGSRPTPRSGISGTRSPWRPLANFISIQWTSDPKEKTPTGLLSVYSLPSLSTWSRACSVTPSNCLLHP